jgi:hypothetical protein
LCGKMATPAPPLKRDQSSSLKSASLAAVAEMEFLRSSLETRPLLALRIGTSPRTDCKGVRFRTDFTRTDCKGVRFRTDFNGVRESQPNLQPHRRKYWILYLIRDCLVEVLLRCTPAPPHRVEPVYSLTVRGINRRPITHRHSCRRQ